MISNKNIRSALKSLSFLWSGTLVGSGSTFLIYMLLARELGVEAFGLFSSSLATITLLTLLAGFGVSKFWLKEFGREGWSAIRWIKPSIKFIYTSTILIVILLAIWAIFGPHNFDTTKILLILSLFLVGQIGVEIVSSKFQLEEKYQTLALWQLVPNLLRLVIIGIVMLLPFQADVFVIVYIYSAIGLIFIYLSIKHLNLLKNGRFELKGHGKQNTEAMQYLPSQKEIFKGALPFGLATFFGFIYYQSDLIMLKYLASDSESGLYNVAFVLLMAILIFPSNLFNKFLLPKYHRWANFEKEKFYNVYVKTTKTMLVFGFVMMSIVFIFSESIVTIFFGAEYLDSVILLQIASLNIPISSVAYGVGAVLVTEEHMKKKIVFMGIVALLNIALNLAFIPYYGAVGASVATVISNLVLLILYLYYARNYIFNIKGNENVAKS